jgi:uncharacterized protein
MRVLVSGSSGLIGSALIVSLPRRGHTAGRLLRDSVRARQDDVVWYTDTGELDPPEPEPLDAVVHLAGESLEGNWNRAKKAEILESRAGPTRRLAEQLARLPKPPKVFITASAIGFYGDRGDAELDESSSPGSGFLADVCRQWEAATRPAAEAGIRTVQMRFGLVLAPHGGVLPHMVSVFQLGLAGRLGSGRQYVSWVALADAAAAIQFALDRPDISGPVNVVAPQPVTNAQFTKTLAGVLGRPAVLPIPGFALRILFGERADELLLSSTRVVPRRLTAAGFEFWYPDLATTLAELLEEI